jgi:hypothetical protein
MKETYGYWVADWDESTDPSKFVFEDIGIASFLVSLWELEMETAKTTKKPSFGSREELRSISFLQR